MFYQDHADPALRFGDVLKGFIVTTPHVNTSNFKNYSIEVTSPIYAVILSPCCSIGDKMISLSPLIEVRGAFFNNPYFEEDLTRLNRIMEPQQIFPPKAWDTFSLEEKQKRLEMGKGYAFVELFIYEQHDLFPRYMIHRKQGNIETNYYMIDFRNCYRVACDEIIKPDHAPLSTKCLQLSIQSRSELREKIAHYFARVPQEDEL